MKTFLLGLILLSPQAIAATCPPAITSCGVGYQLIQKAAVNGCAVAECIRVPGCATQIDCRKPRDPKCVRVDIPLDKDGCAVGCGTVHCPENEK